MITEFLIIFLIIIVVLVFLLFFKSWHLHIFFKNHNFEYNLQFQINFLFMQINIDNIINNTSIKIILNIFSHSKQLYSTYLNSNNSNEEEKESNEEEKESNEVEKDFTVEDENLILKIKQITPLLLENKDDLYQIIITTTKIIKFKYSKLNIEIGLGDNNLTIKLCNLIWALSAPLYPMNFIVILIPKINENIFKTNCDINLDIKLTNLLKIIWIILKNKKLQLLIKMLVR